MINVCRNHSEIEKGDVFWTTVYYYYSSCLAARQLKKVKELIVFREIHLKTTRRHLSMGSHSVICHSVMVHAKMACF